MTRGNGAFDWRGAKTKRKRMRCRVDTRKIWLDYKTTKRKREREKIYNTWELNDSIFKRPIINFAFPILTDPDFIKQQLSNACGTTKFQKKLISKIRQISSSNILYCNEGTIVLSFKVKFCMLLTFICFTFFNKLISRIIRNCLQFYSEIGSAFSTKIIAIIYELRKCKIFMAFFKIIAAGLYELNSFFHKLTREKLKYFLKFPIVLCVRQFHCISLALCS